MLVQDETRLVQAAIRGDNRALAELLRQNYTFLYQYLLKLTMDRNRAEDITQETMLKAIERISTFQAQSKFSTWLIAIASRLAIDGARRGERERQWLRQEEAARSLRFSSLSLMGEWPEALRAIAALEERHRMPVLLKYYYGYSQEEIAAMLEIRVGTVKSRLNAGLKLLRKELGEHEQ